MGITPNDRKILEAFSAMLPIVTEIVKKCLDNDDNVNVDVLANEVSEETKQERASARRVKFWYDNAWYTQNNLVHRVLKDLAKKKTYAELRAMFPSEEILGTDNWQQQILITPEDHDRLSEGYIGRYNTDDPITTKDGVVLIVWTNWGLYKTTRKGERIEDATPKFIRIAERHGIKIRMPE